MSSSASQQSGSPYFTSSESKSKPNSPSKDDDTVVNILCDDLKEEELRSWVHFKVKALNLNTTHI
jgi:hypothetical protein